MASRPHYAAIQVAAAIAAWLLASLGALASFNLELPRAVEQWLSALAAPGIFALAFWNPLLRQIGLARGEWFTLPSPLGCVVVIAIYSLLGYGLTRLAFSHRCRKKS